MKDAYSSSQPSNVKERNEFEMDPEQKRQIVEKLNVLKKERLRKEGEANSLAKSLNQTKAELKELNEDTGKFNLVKYMDVDNNKKGKSYIDFFSFL